MKPFHALCILVILSAVNLALMIPGGFVETRTFPGYSVAVLAAFNIFLTCLGIGSLALGYRMFRTGHAGISPIVVGVAYVAVYALDLAHIFPIAKAPMSKMLAATEWIGIILGVTVIVLGLRLAVANEEAAVSGPAPSRTLLLTLGMAGLLIVVFATLSAI
tara:strand:- start:190 stop:672 length:483 start_codon:yes stop_codon:yes gene_type:complete